MSNSERKRNIELDVLRVLSCAAVLLYHLGFLKGGYLAVCTFFVMSGYLSARAALSGEKFNILKYYVKRFLHIYLPLAVTVLVTILVVTAFPQIKWLNLKPETTSVLLGYNNRWQLLASLDYFARHVDSPFMHFWYIAIQLQFDVLFPFVFLLLRWFKRKLSVALPCALLVLGSAISMLWFYILASKGQVMQAYYSTASRCFALLLGVLMGFYQSEQPPLSFKFERRPAVARAVFCVWLAVWCGLVYVSDAASEFFPHIMMAFTIVSMRLIDMAVLCGQKAPRAFGRFMQGLAGISYEVYLWQYPVIFLAQELVPTTFDPILKYILMIALILALSAVLHFAAGFKPFSGRARAKAENASLQAENPVRLASPAEKMVPEASEYHTASLAGAQAAISADIQAAGPAGAVDAESPAGTTASSATRREKHENKRRAGRKTTAVLALRILVLLAVLVPTAFGGWRYYQAEDHTAELAAMEAMMEENAAMLAERQKEFAQKQAQQAAEWEAALADFDSGEEKIKEAVANLPIVGLGDSVMLGAVPALYETFPNGYFDAAVSRSAWVVRGILADLAEQGVSYDTVVMNFGANGDCPDEEKEKILQDLAGKQVYWLTNTWPKTQFVNDRIRALAERYDNLTILDWQTASAGHDEYFYTDGLHLTEPGRKAFASFIYDSIFQDRIAEWQAARDEFIRKHDEEYQKTLAFYGDQLLVGVYDQLSAAFPQAQFASKEGYSYEALKADLSAAAENGSLAYRVALVCSQPLSEAQRQELEAICEGSQLFFARLPESNDIYMADGVHFSPKTNAFVAQQLTEALR